MSDDDLLAQIHAELEQDRVYVDPALADQFSAEELAVIEEGAAEHDAYVVAYPFQSRDQFGGEADDLLARLHDSYGVDGLYLSNWRIDFGEGNPNLTAVAYGPRHDDYYVEFTIGRVLDDEEPEDLGAAYARTFELMDLPESEVRELEKETYADLEPDGNGFSDAVDGIPAWVWPALLVPVISAVAWRWLVQRRAFGPVTALPPSAVARIRDAHDQRLVRQAREELLQLGEAIDAAELSPSDDTSAWQAALDHYDAGQRLLDAAEPDVLDVIGGIVLCRRGRAALEAARTGQAWTPAKPCFLNPLHGVATTQRKVSWESGGVNAPLCTHCNSQLERRKTPDILDVARRGKPLHYFETDLEPWASTGYGALHEDLVERLHQRDRP